MSTPTEVCVPDPPAACSDEQLALLLQAGCEQSFEEFDRRYRRRLLQLLSKRLPQRHDAEDVVQQTLVRVFQKINQYRADCRLSPWVFTIALRLAVEHGRRRRIPLGTSASDGIEAADRSPTPEQLVMEREQRDWLWALADKVLNSNQWTALWLFYGEELTLEEVARSLGKSKTGTSVLLFRARKALLPHLRRLSESYQHPTKEKTEKPIGAQSNLLLESQP